MQKPWVNQPICSSGHHSDEGLIKREQLWNAWFALYLLSLRSVSLTLHGVQEIFRAIEAAKNTYNECTMLALVLRAIVSSYGFSV